MARVKKFFTKDGRVRVSAAITTDVVKEAARIQKTLPLATLGLGRVLTGAVLLASQQKDGHRLSLRFHGDGPLGTLFAESSFESKIRCYCQNPTLELPPTKKGHLDIVTAIGNGYLSVANLLPHTKEPHIGITPILTGEIGEDIGFYLRQSHQVQSVVSLSVTLGPKGEIKAAGGAIVELLPGAPDTLIHTLEERAAKATPLSSQLLAGATERDFVSGYVHDSPLVEEEHPFDMAYECPCSVQRVERTLGLLGKGSLSEMALKGDDVKVNCQFCGRGYSVAIKRIRELLDELSVN